MSESQQRKAAADALAQTMLPLSQKINDYLFTSEEFKKMQHGTMVTGLAVLLGAWAKMIGVKLGDVHLLVESAYANVEAGEKSGAEREAGDDGSEPQGA